VAGHPCDMRLPARLLHGLPCFGTRWSRAATARYQLASLTWILARAVWTELHVHLHRSVVWHRRVFLPAKRDSTFDWRGRDRVSSTATALRACIPLGEKLSAFTAAGDVTWPSSPVSFSHVCIAATCPTETPDRNATFRATRHIPPLLREMSLFCRRPST
jgi:hypothetical protein